jgi:hypothetical protein
MNASVILCVALGLISSCRPAHPRLVTIVPLYGPAIGRDTITGRADDAAGGVWLMVGGTSLVRIDLATGKRSEVELKVNRGEPFWGLARLADATLWTLNGQNTLTQLAADGTVVREVGPANAYLGIFSGGDRLVLQRTSLPANTPAMMTMIPGVGEERPWGGMTVRGFERLASGAAAAMNLVSCGTSERAEMPCWFPEEPALSLIAADGTTRRLVLEGIPQVAPELLINAAVPLRPIRDVFVERDGTIWVLASGESPDSNGGLPGGWLLARYGSQGQPIDRRVLPEPVRMILRAGSGRALVLTGAGMVAEVQP